MMVPESSAVTIADLERETFRIAEQSARKGLLVRTFGSLAVRLIARSQTAMLDRLRPLPKDIDLITLPFDMMRCRELLRESDWTDADDTVVFSEGLKLSMRHMKLGINLDVYPATLGFNQRLDLRDRLVLSFPTITPSDLLLTKIQILRPTLSDIVDTSALLLSCPLGTDDASHLSTPRISSVLRKSWRWRWAVRNWWKQLTAMDFVACGFSKTESTSMLEAALCLITSLGSATGPSTSFADRFRCLLIKPFTVPE